RQVVDHRRPLDRARTLLAHGHRVLHGVAHLDVGTGSGHGVLGEGVPAVDVLGLAVSLLLALTARVLGGHHVVQGAVTVAGHGHRVGDGHDLADREVTGPA